MKKSIFDQDIITLDEPTHQYKVKTAEHLRFTSVTTFIGEFFEPFDARAIATKLAKSGRGKYANMSVSQILRAWEEISERGTAVHLELENYINAWKINSQLPVMLDDKAKHGQLWIDEMFEPHYVPYTEVKIYSTQYQLAGTVDLLVHNPKTDRWVMADWKTNETITTSSWGGKKGIHHATRLLEDCKLTKYAVQMSMYQYLLESEYGIKIDNRILVHLRPKQTLKFPLGVKTYETEYLKANVVNMLEDRLQKKLNGELFFSPL